MSRLDNTTLSFVVFLPICVYAVSLCTLLMTQTERPLFPVSTLSDTLRCQVIIYLPYSGTGMSQVEEERERMKIQGEGKS